MSYEFRSDVGVVRLFRRYQRWSVELNGLRRGKWTSAQQAARAVASHKSGLSIWDDRYSEVSDDLLDWRPLDDSL